VWELGRKLTNRIVDSALDYPKQIIADNLEDVIGWHEK
jgi:hypothetical protein